MSTRVLATIFVVSILKPHLWNFRFPKFMKYIISQLDMSCLKHPTMAPGFHGRSTAVAFGWLWGPGYGHWRRLVPLLLPDYTAVPWGKPRLVWSSLPCWSVRIYHVPMAMGATWPKDCRTKMRKKSWLTVPSSIAGYHEGSLPGTFIWKSSASAAQISEVQAALAAP